MSTLPLTRHRNSDYRSLKSYRAAWVLSLLVGALGVDRFYLGKIGTGLLKLVTAGGLGVWWLADLIVTLSGGARDRWGRTVRCNHPQAAWAVAGLVTLTPVVVVAANIGMGTPVAVDTARTAASWWQQTVPTVTPGEAAPTTPTTPGDAATDTPDEPLSLSEWTVENFGTFEAVTLSGSGDETVPLPDGARAGTITADYDGWGNFSVAGYDNGETTDEVLVNTMGSYHGTTLFGVNSGDDSDSLHVVSNGDWTLEIKPVSAAPIVGGVGESDAVFLYDGDEAALRATYENSDLLRVYATRGDTPTTGAILNTSGTGMRTTFLGDSPSIIQIRADSPWELSINRRTPA